LPLRNAGKLHCGGELAESWFCHSQPCNLQQNIKLSKKSHDVRVNVARAMPSLIIGAFWCFRP